MSADIRDVEWLRGYLREVLSLSSVRHFAKKHGVSPTLVTQFVNGKYAQCPPKLAAAMGFERRVMYVDLAGMADNTAIPHAGGTDA